MKPEVGMIVDCIDGFSYRITGIRGGQLGISVLQYNRQSLKGIRSYDTVNFFEDIMDGAKVRWAVKTLLKEYEV